MISEAAFPTLTYAERDRRWAALRSLMDDHDVAALIVFGSGRDALDHYLSNEGARGVVILPRDGEPVYLVEDGNTALLRYDIPGALYERWIDDVRVSEFGAGVVATIRDLGLSGDRVGVVGLTSRSVGDGDGRIPYTLWARVVGDLPDAAFIDVSDPFERLVLVKSPEELPLLRKAAGIGESVCQAFIDAIDVGVYERQVAAAAFAALLTGGGWALWPWILLRSGPECLGWDIPEWFAMGGPSRQLRRGDVIGAELFCCYAGYESQQQIVASVGGADDEHARLAEVALASYRVGVQTIRPGVTFAGLCDVMQAPLVEAGCWNLGPLVQTVSPVLFNSAQKVGIELQPELAGIPLPSRVDRDGDLVLEPGMALAMEPNALSGKHRICVGGTVLVTEDGCEELNELPNQLNVIDVARR